MQHAGLRDSLASLFFPKAYVGHTSAHASHGTGDILTGAETLSISLMENNLNSDLNVLELFVQELCTNIMPRSLYPTL